jgi:hypothetical protein
MLFVAPVSLGDSHPLVFLDARVLLCDLRLLGLPGGYGG